MQVHTLEVIVALKLLALVGLPLEEGLQVHAFYGADDCLELCPSQRLAAEGRVEV